MATNYPGAFDSFDDPGQTQDSPSHAKLHNDLNDAVEAIEQTLGLNPQGDYASVRARLNVGWQHITSGQFVAQSAVDISIPPSTYRMIRVYLSGVTSETGTTLRMRVNNDTTPDLHRRMIGVLDGNDGYDGTTALDTSWIIANWTSTERASCEVLIQEANVPSRLPMISRFGAYTGSAAGSRVGVATGALSSNTLLTSLRILPGTGTIGGHYIVEGYRLPS